MSNQFLVNRWNEWTYDIHKHEKNKCWGTVGGQLPSERPKAKYTSSGRGRGGAAKLKGWNDLGMKRWNEIYSMVLKDRSEDHAYGFEN